MKIQKNKATEGKIDVRRGTIEGIVIVDGRPQIERADMPLAFSFDSIEDLERFCEAVKSRSPDQH